VVHAASELQALLSNVPDAPCLKRFEMEGLRLEPGSLLAPVLPGAFLCRLPSASPTIALIGIRSGTLALAQPLAWVSYIVSRRWLSVHR
jgi:hypothetical protein